jgi:hypothetical protein
VLDAGQCAYGRWETLGSVTGDSSAHPSEHCWSTRTGGPKRSQKAFRARDPATHAELFLAAYETVGQLFSTAVSTLALPICLATGHVLTYTSHLAPQTTTRPQNHPPDRAPSVHDPVHRHWRPIRKFHLYPTIPAHKACLERRKKSKQPDSAYRFLPRQLWRRKTTRRHPPPRILPQNPIIQRCIAKKLEM